MSQENVKVIRGVLTPCGGAARPSPWVVAATTARPIPTRVFDTRKWVSGGPMGVVFSIFLIAVGAILRYATNFDVRSVDVDEVGLILMIVGAVGFVLSLLYEVFWARERSRWYRYGGRGRDVPPGPDEPRY